MFQAKIVEVAVKEAVKKVTKKVSQDDNLKTLELENEIANAVVKYSADTKRDREIILKAVMNGLEEEKMSREETNQLVMRALEKSMYLKHSMMRRHRPDGSLGKNVSILLMITGCLMIAAPLTWVYLRKLKERRQNQGLMNRLQQYVENTETGDRSNFVADNYAEQIKDENVLNPKYLSGSK